MSQSDSDDARNLEIICNGDRKAAADATAVLYRSYGRPFRAYFMQNRIDPSQAYDLSQEVFISVFRNACQFRGEAKASSWLWTIARRKLLNWIAKEDPDVRPTHYAGEEPEFEAGGIAEGAREDEPGAPGRPRHHLLEECIAKAFLAFASTHPEQAETLRRRVLDGWSVEEIASFLGRTPGATRQFLYQSRLLFAPFAQPCRQFLSEQKE